MRWFNLFLVCVILSSCSVQQRARRLVRQGWDKLDRAVRLDPTVADSAFRYREVVVKIPGRIDTVAPEFVLDSLAMRTTLDRYDSLVDIVNAFQARAGGGIWDMTADGVEAIREKQAIQRRLAPAFIRDSTYRYPVDSVLTVLIHTHQGYVSGVGIHRNVTTLKAKIPAVQVTFDGSRLRPFYRDPWFVGCCILFLLLLVVLTGLARIHRHD